MGDPFVLVVVVLLTVAGIGGLVLYLLMPARQRFLQDDPINDSPISSQWPGGDNTPAHHLPSHHNVIHHDFSGHGGMDGGGGSLH